MRSRCWRARISKRSGLGDALIIVPRFILQPDFVAAQNFNRFLRCHGLLAKPSLYGKESARSHDRPENGDCQASKKPPVRIIRECHSDQSCQSQRKYQESGGKKQATGYGERNRSFKRGAFLLYFASQQLNAGLNELLQLAFHFAQDTHQASAVVFSARHYRLDLQMRTATPTAKAVPAIPPRRATGFSSLRRRLRPRTP